MDAADRRYEQRFSDSQKAVDAALSAAEKAVVKAEGAAERRFDSVNEFRATLEDQQRLLIPRLEAESRMAAIDRRLEIAERVLAEGSSRRLGSQATIAYGIAAISSLIAIASFLIPLLRGKA
jgi:hypothetical protein